MPNLTIQRLGYACGARVTGVDLSKPVSAADLEAIREAWLENLVLVFPNQKLDPRSLVAFTRNFGELDDYATQPFNRHRRPITRGRTGTPIFPTRCGRPRARRCTAWKSPRWAATPCSPTCISPTSGTRRT